MRPFRCSGAASLLRGESPAKLGSTRSNPCFDIRPAIDHAGLLGRAQLQVARAASLHVHVPSHPPAPVTSTRGHEPDLATAKLICHVIVVEGGPGALRPVAVDETVLDYVKGHGVTAEGSIEVEGLHVSYTLGVQELTTWQDPPLLAATVNHSFKVRGAWGSSSSSGSGGRVPLDELHCRRDIGGAGRFSRQRPLSVVRGARRRFHLFYSITRADADDPLESVTLTRFVQDHHVAIAKAVKESTGTRHSRRRSDMIPMRGMALADHIGASALLLGVAWLLLVQLFRRRTAALVAVAMAMVLYVAALDRWALGAHLSHLADPSAPLRDRITACDQATDTFFYGKTAIEGLRKVADDPATPSVLRDRARETAENIDCTLPGRGYM